MNQHEGPFSADEQDQLEQELLELHFGCHPDAERLEARLAAEPALRALQREVLQQATMLETAVRPDLPRLALRQPHAAPSRWRLLRSPTWRLLTTAAAAAICVLGFFVNERVAQSRNDSYRSDHLHLTVSAPRAVPAGAHWNFTVQAQDLDGVATDCRVQWQAFGDNGNVLAANEAALTGGSATITMPADLNVPKRVEVVAKSAEDEVRQVFELSTAAAAPLVQVTTDRPVYRPGEPVFVRAVVLDRVTRLPLATPPRMQARLLDAKDAPVANDNDMTAPGGVGSFLLQVPADSQGGPHRVQVASADGAFPAESTEIVVRSFQTPQLKKTIVLDRVSYAPGARGSAALTVQRLATDTGASGASAKGSLVVDGNEVWSETRPLGANGEVTFAFTVPSNVDKGAGRFVATVNDGGIVETEVKPFVVPTGKVLVAAFPEGGELVAGVENGLYLECTDPLGRSIDGFGEVLDAHDQQVAKFKTAHQGRVRLGFVPRQGGSYHVRLAGHDETFPLPEVKDHGIALRLLGDDIAANAPLHVAVAGRGDGPWLLGVFCRGVLVAQTTLRADDGGELRADTEVPLPAYACGVLRATVFDRSLQPIAERLVRRLTAQRVDVSLTPKNAVVAPGDGQQLDVRTTDEAGNPIAAVCGVSVTDLAAVSLGSEPRVGLADQAMLFADVERMENLGDFFLGNTESPRNVDLLLGTRGWRRFVWTNDAKAQAAIAAQGKIGEGTLAREGFSHTPQVVSNLAAASAPGQALAGAEHRAERNLADAAGVSAVVLLLLGIVEVMAWLLRRTLHLTPVWQGRIGVATAVALLVFFGFQGPRTQLAGGRFDAVVDARVEAEDFIKDLAPVIPRFGAPPVRLPFDLGQGGWDDRFMDPDGLGRRYMAIGTNGWQFDPNYGGSGVNGEPFANPLAGAFYTDRDADIRARTENFFRLDLADNKATNLSYDEFDRVSAWLGHSGYRASPAIGDFGDWRQRQYAHQHVASDARRDFAPTLYWNTLLLTDASGNATAHFATSDAVTTWLVQADAHVATGTVGRLGQSSTTFTAQQPFHVEAKLPDEVSAGDRLLLPIAATSTDASLTTATLDVKVGNGLHVAVDAPTTIHLTNGRGRALLPITVDTTIGATTITIESHGGRFTDRVQHTLTIAPRGFPHRRSAGGSVAANTPATWTVAIPADAVPDSGHVTLKVFPSPIAALTAGLEGMLQEPCGCFEQASSSNYPNTLVLTLLDASGDNVPTIAARAHDLLPRGYAKITGYECKSRGYEWFGGDPGHEALTAYGLLEFHDMAKVYDVDASMVERTKTWLMSRRDGSGGYLRNSRALDRFGGATQRITDAYVTYALLVAGVPASELQKEIAQLAARIDSKDAYELALLTCALQLADRTEAATARQHLANLQQDDGSLHGTTTITQSGGNDLIVESTGFAALAFLQDPKFQGQARKAIEFLQSQRSASGTFGATQATIVALRALTAYATANRKMREAGTLRVFEGEHLLGERPFTADETGAITFDLWRQLPAGEHTLRLTLEGGGEGATLPFACDVSYHAEQPADDPDAAIAITTSLRNATVREGDTVALDVTVTNRAHDIAPTPIAILGLPAGCELPTRVLEDLQKAGQFAFWELRGRELVLYWRELAPGAEQKLTLDLVARVPGHSSGPASRGYLYYTAEQKRWAAPLAIDITAAR